MSIIIFHQPIQVQLVQHISHVIKTYLDYNEKAISQIFIRIIRENEKE